MTLTLPFSSGIATQEYLVAEEGVLRAYEEGCSHWYVDLSLPSDLVCEWPGERRRALVRLYERLGIRPVLHGNFRTPLATEVPEVRAGVTSYMHEEILLAKEFNAPLIVHGGCIVDPRPTESARWSALQRFLMLTTEILAYAQDQGVTIWLENLSHYPRFRPFNYVFTRYSDFVAAKESVPNVKFLFDIGHANVNQKFPMEILRDFGDSIDAISVSNNDGKADSHLSIERGTVPIDDVVAMIKSIDWQGVVAFETRDEMVEAGVSALRRKWDNIQAYES